MDISQVEKPTELENYQQHWGFVDWADKVVLDIGADYGSTAYFFLEQGAKAVIAVEPHLEREYLDASFYPRLVELSKKLPQITPVEMFVSTAADFEKLFTEYEVDVAKIDIEGGEVGLLDLRIEVLQRIPEYVIEVHPGRGFPITVEHSYTPQQLIEALRTLFERAGYEELNFVGVGRGILHFKRYP